MKIKAKSKSVLNRKNKILLYTKIINTLSSFVKSGHSTKKDFHKTSYNTESKNNFIHKSFTKNISSSRNYSKTEINNSSYNDNSYLIEQEKQITNPLYLLYKNKFYPHSYKNKNYIREVYHCLPPLKLVNNNINESSCNYYNNITNINQQINKSNYYNKKINEILSTEYENSVNDFNNIYKNNGEELLYDLGKSKEFNNESVIDVIKQNEIDMKETNYISSILGDKKGKKNYSVKLKNEKFIDPKNSLLTLKINNQLMNNLKEAGVSYAYNTYVNQINEKQKNKLQLLVMPKPKIKVMKYAFELSNNQNNLENAKIEGEEKSKKLLTINRHLFRKINKKIDKDTGNVNDNKDNKKEKEKDNQENPENNQQNPNEKLTINSTIMRNILIVEVKSYYCKYLLHSSVNPCSRMGATFINCYNKLFLFGGLLASDQSDLWKFEIKNKTYTWKKIKYNKELNFNPRYGHSCVFFNNSLYIFGGNLNIKKLKYPLEDILIYNINTNTMKIGSFKVEKYSFSSNNIYIPQRRNHIAQTIGWNMIVHGGIDINKEYLRENIGSVNEEEIRYQNEINNMEVNGDVLGDIMAMDLNTLKWMKLSNIIYKLKGKKAIKKPKNGIPRVYHSSCLVLSFENIVKGNKLNIYKNNSNIKDEYLENDVINSNLKLEVKYEGIYIFGGLDEYFKDTNNLFILHCFRNPLVFFEPLINGAPPSPRHMAVMNFNKILNFITIYGGKDSFRIFNDLYILDIMNFQWIKIDLFGPHEISGRMGHCGGIINEKLYIFGGCDEDNKYPTARVLCIELDLLRNKKLSKIFDFAKNTLIQSPKDKTAKNVMQLLKEGAEIPHDIYPFLQLD